MSIKRYKPLIRSKPLLRKHPNVSSGRNSGVYSEDKRKAIPKKTEKKIEQDKIYYLIREVFLRRNPYCKAGLSGCTCEATDIHHLRGRGIWYLVIRYFLPVCRNCHDKIGVMGELAFKFGLSIPRNRVEYRYLQPNYTDTIAILLELGFKLTITY